MGSAPSTTFISSFAGNSLVMDKQSMMVRQLLLGNDTKKGDVDVSNRSKTYSLPSHHSSSGSSITHASKSHESSPVELCEHHAPLRSISPTRRRASENGSIGSSISSLSDSMDSSKGRVKSIQSNGVLHSYELWSNESIDFENCRQETEMQNIQMEIKKKSPKNSEKHDSDSHHHNPEHKKTKKYNGWVEEPLSQSMHHSPSHHHSTHHSNNHHSTNHHHSTHHHHSSRHEHHHSNHSAHSTSSTSKPSSVLSPITTRHSHDSSILATNSKLSPLHHEATNFNSAIQQPSVQHNAFNLPLIPFHLNLSASWDSQKAIVI